MQSDPDDRTMPMLFTTPAEPEEEPGPTPRQIELFVARQVLREDVSDPNAVPHYLKLSHVPVSVFQAVCERDGHLLTMGAEADGFWYITIAMARGKGKDFVSAFYDALMAAYS